MEQLSSADGGVTLKYLNLLIFLMVAGNFQQALYAEEYEENPDGPNGYRATCFKTHYHGNYNGPTEECNGYEATAIRSRYGIQPLLTPKSEDHDNDGWGSGWGDSDKPGGGGSGFLSRRFGNRGGSQWSNHFGSQQQQQQGGNNSRLTMQQMAGAALTAKAMQEYRQYRKMSPYPASTALNGYHNQNVAQQAGYSSNSSLNQYSANGSALQHAMQATPLRNMLRNSQGGFNRIYAAE